MVVAYWPGGVTSLELKLASSQVKNAVVLNQVSGDKQVILARYVGDSDMPL